MAREGDSHELLPMDGVAEAARTNQDSTVPEIAADSTRTPALPTPRLPQFLQHAWAASPLLGPRHAPCNHDSEDDEASTAAAAAVRSRSTAGLWARIGWRMVLGYGAVHLLIAAAMDAPRAAPALFCALCTLLWHVLRRPTAADLARRCLERANAALFRVSKPHRIGVTSLFQLLLTGSAAGILAGTLVQHLERAVAVCGVVVCLGLAVLLCPRADRRHIPWRSTVVPGLSLQVVLAGLVIRTHGGSAFFLALGRGAERLLSYANAGSDFVFSEELADSAFVAFRMLPAIVFFSAVSSVCFYLGLVQVLVEVLGSAMQELLATTRLESVCAACNIFLGQSEAPLLVAPLLPAATLSEIHAIMTAGFSSVGGGVLAAYIAMGVPAHHLIAASVISAPAALVISKIACPPTPPPPAPHTPAREVRAKRPPSVDGGAIPPGADVRLVREQEAVNAGHGCTESGWDGAVAVAGAGAGEGAQVQASGGPVARASDGPVTPRVGGADVAAVPGATDVADVAGRGMLPAEGTPTSNTVAGKLVAQEDNVFDALTAGATRGVGVAGAIGGCLVAFIAVQTLLNQLVGWWFGLIGLPYMDLAYFLGRLAWPVAFLMGIATNDCESVSRLVIS